MRAPLSARTGAAGTFHRSWPIACTAIPPTAPYAEGACFVGKTGINKAEYMAVIQGLRLVEDRMYVGDWTRDPVHVVCDNIFVVKQAIGDWEATDLGFHLDLLNEATGDLYRMTSSPVFFIHVANDENSGRSYVGQGIPLRLRWA